jgi:intracellular sulfur oxidation DsrE/DsrF family protein
MARKTKLMAVALFALAVLLVMGVAAWAGGYAPQKVVYQINSGDFTAIGGALRNIQNHINAVGEDKLNIIVVVHGGGHLMFRKGKTNDQIVSKIKSLQKQGVKFAQCAITLQRKKLSLEKDMVILTKADLVPSGVAEIAKLELNGYAYIKP